MMARSITVDLVFMVLDASRGDARYGCYDYFSLSKLDIIVVSCYIVW